MSTANKQITPSRKTLYYGGMALGALGLLLFLAAAFAGALNVGNADIIEGQARFEGLGALIGFVLMLAGGLIANVGAKGWAGSGIVLDPERARVDVEPWSRMSGGVIHDALSEAEVVKAIEERLQPPKPVVKIRCQECQALNDETARFCNQCGSEF